MALEFGTAKSTGSSSNVIVQKVKVDDIKVTYGEKQEWQKFADDIGLDITLDIGKDFKPNFYIGGSFKVDEMNGEIVGWGRAFKIKMFFDAIGLPIKLAKGSTVADNRLPEGARDAIVGKEFLRLSYMTNKIKPNGSARYKDWQDTAAVGQETKLKAQFDKSVSDGYIKDFSPPGSSPETGNAPTWDDMEGEDPTKGLPL